MNQYYKPTQRVSSTYTIWQFYGLYADGIGFFADFKAVGQDGRVVHGRNLNEVWDAIVTSDYHKASSK